MGAEVVGLDGGHRAGRQSLGGTAVVILLLCALAGSAAAHQVAGEPELPTLTIIAAPELRPTAAQIERLDRSTFVSVMRLVGLRHAGPPITVILSTEQSGVARETPSWIAGFAQAATSAIVLFPARTPSYPHDS